MRSAPFGFLGTDTPEYAWWAACESAAYTHGHPTGQHAAGALAVLIWHLAAGRELMAAVEGTVRFLEAQPGTAETLEALSAAVRAAGTGRPSAEALETLGGGWVAEEALAIAVYASLCYPAEGDVRHGLALSVTHSGDSDSTGSICGNILGAAHGFTALPADLAFQVEGRSTILLLADDLWTQLARGEAIHDSPQWWDRYPGF
jgi:ADP-ribosylglycohydrolase